MTDPANAAEQKILSALMFEPDRIREYSITTDLFGNEANRAVFDAMAAAIGPAGDLAHDKALAGMDPALMDYYAALMDGFVSAADFEYNYQTLTESAAKRKIAALIELYQSGDISADSLAKSIIHATETRPDREDRPIDPGEIMEMLTAPNQILACPGFSDLIEALRIGRNTLNVISATTGTGKSSFALNLFWGFCQNPEYKPIYFNLEMTRETVWRRLTAIGSGVPIAAIDDKIQAEQTRKVSNFLVSAASGGLTESTIISGSKSAEEIGVILARVTRQNKGRHVIAFIDLLSHIKGGRERTERERLAGISQALHALTKDLNVTIFLLQQLNREAYGSDQIGPQHLKGTGQTVEDADSVLVLDDFSKRFGHSSDPVHFVGVRPIKGRTSGYTRTKLFQVRTETQNYLPAGRVPDWLMNELNK